MSICHQVEGKLSHLWSQEPANQTMVTLNKTTTKKEDEALFERKKKTTHTKKSNAQAKHQAEGKKVWTIKENLKYMCYKT